MGQRRDAVLRIQLSCLGLMLSLLALGCEDGQPRQPRVEAAESAEKQGEAVTREISFTLPGTGPDAPRTLPSGERHVYACALAADELLHVIVEQQGVDLALELRDPHGALVVKVDSPSGTEGSEELFAISRQAGPYELVVVAPPGAPPGHYAFTTIARRPPTAADRELARAEDAYWQAYAALAGDREAVPSAVAQLQTALEIWTRHQQPARQANAWRELGRAHQHLNQYRQALTCYQSAAELCRDLGDLRNHAAREHDVGWMHFRLGEWDLAEQQLEQALALFQALGEPAGMALTLAHLGTLASSRGQLQRALETLEQALTLLDENARPEITATTLHGLAEVYLALKSPAEARDAYQRAYALYQRLGNERLMARSRKGMADAALQQGDLAAAREQIAPALAQLRQQQDARGQAVALITLANVERTSGNQVAARQAFAAAQALAQAAGEQHTQAMVWLEQAQLEREAGQFERSLALYAQAAQSFTALDDPNRLASCHAGRARTLRQLGQLDAAQSQLAEAIAQVENLRDQPARPGLRRQYFAFRQDYYELAIDLAVARFEQAASATRAALIREALELDEQRRARGLLDRFAEARLNLRTTASPEWRAREAALQQELRELVGPAGVSSTGVRPTAQLLRQLDHLYGELRQHARPAALESRPTATLPEIQQQLDPETLVLVYSLGAERSFLWAVGPHDLALFVLPERAKIESLVDRFLHSLQDRRPATETARRQTGHQLSRLLLAPVAGRLAQQRLVIVGDGKLQALPFAALPAPQSNAPLLLAHEIVTVPSLSTLIALRQARPRPAGPPRILALADPVFSREDSRLVAQAEPAGPPGPAASAARPPDLVRSIASQGAEGFRRLAFTGLEAEAVLALVPVDHRRLVLGFAANRQTLDRETLRAAHILHFATHATLNPQHPELSALILSLFDDQGRPQNGWWPASEIAALDLIAELVVLSACETGLGPELRGEGLQGLAQSFFYAGARRVLASSWRVSDQHTAELMTHFYRAHLEQGQTPAAALRHAQLTMLHQEKTTAPYFWAGFVLQGEWR